MLKESCRSPHERSYLDEIIFERVPWASVDHATLAAEAEASNERNVRQCDAYRRLQDAGIVLTTGEALIPSYLFKTRQIVIDGIDVNNAKSCTSSGTLGSKSVVLRDDRTLERFVGTVAYGIDRLFDSHDRRRAFVIGPDADEAGDLWFSYVLSLVDIIYTTNFYVRDGKTDFSRLYADISRETFYQPFLVAPPALIVDFVDYIRAIGAKLDLGAKDGLLITAGGWKNRRSQEIEQDAFRDMCSAAFNLPLVSIRDSFNMVELNTVLFECEHHRMHVPPWLRVSAIRPDTLQPTGQDEDGVLCFIDPTAISFPCAILSEDVGRVVDVQCECGVESPVLTFTRRVKANEQRGCGMKMSQYDAG